MKNIITNTSFALLLIVFTGCSLQDPWQSYNCKGEIVRIHDGNPLGSTEITEDCEYVGDFNCPIVEGDTHDAHAANKLVRLQKASSTYSDNKCLLPTVTDSSHAVTHFLTQDGGLPVEWGLELELRGDDQEYLGSLACLERRAGDPMVMYEILPDSTKNYYGYHPGIYGRIAAYFPMMKKKG